MTSLARPSGPQVASRFHRRAGLPLVTLTVVAALVALLGAACSSDDTGTSADGGTTKTSQAPATLTTAIERSAGYFQERPPRGDVGFLIGQASMHLSPAFRRWSEAMQPDPAVTQAMKDPAALQYLEATMWMQRGQQHQPWAPLAAPPVTPSSKPSALTDDELSGVTQVMSMALKCDQLNPTQRQQWLDRLSTPSHSYLLTHQLLSLVWGRNAGCLTDAEAAPLRTALATALYAELLADGTTVNDLSLERMAMLCYADLCDWVSDAQTDAVRTKQHADGSWGDGSVPIHPNAFVPPEHTAGLGFYVLAMKWDPSSPPPSPPA